MTDSIDNPDSPGNKPFLVAAFYKFVELTDCEAIRGPLQQRCEDLGLLGTILLAAEGINGTISGKPEKVRRLFERLREDPRFEDLHYKESWAADQPFYRMRVRLKKEIVSLGFGGGDFFCSFPYTQPTIASDPDDTELMMEAEMVTCGWAEV